MKRINDQNNSPEEFDRKFNGTLGITDMVRHYELSRYFDKGVYVDIGCFDSIMPILVAERGIYNHVIAFDYAPKMIDFLQERFLHVDYRCADVSKGIPMEDKEADYIVAGEFIEHLDQPGIFIEDAMRVLKRGGWLAISTPYEEKNRSVGGNLHVWSFSLSDMKEFGFTEIEILGEQSGPTMLAWQQKV